MIHPPVFSHIPPMCDLDLRKTPKHFNDSTYCQGGRGHQGSTWVLCAGYEVCLIFCTMHDSSSCRFFLMAGQVINLNVWGQTASWGLWHNSHCGPFSCFGVLWPVMKVWSMMRFHKYHCRFQFVKEGSSCARRITRIILMGSFFLPFFMSKGRLHCASAEYYRFDKGKDSL